jgi:hypothetical protein
VCPVQVTLNKYPQVYNGGINPGQKKMVTNSFGNRIFMQPIGGGGKGIRGIFFHFSFVPNKFPICSLGSQCVPQGVPSSFSL